MTISIELATLPERFQRRIDVQPDGCWVWIGYRRPDGYGCAYLHNKKEMAHRAVYMASGGTIPEGLQLDHLCRVITCVNPAHLEPVTYEENHRRKMAAYTHCINGHPFDEANTYILPSNGYRSCRTCNRAAVRRYSARKRGQR